MLRLRLDNDRRSYKILCLGSHSDDIEIGCGGTILQLTEGYENTEFHWVVFSSEQKRAKEAIKSADLFLSKAKHKNVVIKDFRDGFFPFVGDKIKDFLKETEKTLSPDIIFTHYRNDLHQDHRLISDLTWQVFRDHLILEYEIPKYDGDLGSPNHFVHLDKPTCNKKIQSIIRTFKTQHSNSWFSKETFLALLRIRGVESNSLHGYAEAFYCRKAVFS